MSIAQRVVLAGIPCLVLRPAAAPAPIVLWHHGWGGDKGDAAAPPAPARALVEAGFLVVCPDAPEHGERASALGRVRRTFNGWAVICAAMEAARAEASALVDAVFALPGATSWVAVAGVSMGGVIAQLAAAAEPRVAALVSVLGRSSLHQADPWCRAVQAGTWCERWCDANAPATHAERYRALPTLFVDGGRDEDCPALINARTVAAIRALGGDAAQIVDDDAGHELTGRMTAAMVDWLRGRAGSARAQGAR